jgi:hypothetical protein
MEPPNLDPLVMLTCLQKWAAAFCDDASPAQVTHILVAFAFLVGLNVAAARPEHVEGLLRIMHEEMPSANEHARSLADALVRQDHDHGSVDTLERQGQVDPSHPTKLTIPPFARN